MQKLRVLAHAVLLMTGLILGSAASAQNAGGHAQCPRNATGIQGALICSCPAGSASGSVWGTGLYTTDSSVCNAAQHAGAIAAGQGGLVEITLQPGLNSYVGSAQNGVTTRNWGSYGSSFQVTKHQPAPQYAQCPRQGQEIAEQAICACPAGQANGSVWGTGVYTGDSALCAAAQHAGAFSPNEGGLVVVSRMSGLNAYAGSNQNGVSSQSWGSFGNSFTVVRFFAPGQEKVALPTCSKMPDGADTHSCTCPPNPVARSVWGNGPYTADSDLCSAAVHDGYIEADTGGVVNVLRMRGLESYLGDQSNGITTGDWNAYSSSVIFDWNQ